MKVQGRRVLVCDCEHTLALDRKRVAAALAADEPVVFTHLCRSQIGDLRGALAAGEPLLVCCTQETPLFEEIREQHAPETPAAYVNIRERAGWAAEGAEAYAKVAALIAEAALDIELTPSMSLASNGVCLVYGSGEIALDAAARLARRLKVTCLLSRTDGAMPPPVREFPIFAGRIREARGHLGAFDLVIDGFAACQPSSRREIVFELARDGARSTFDLILDCSGSPALFPAADRRDGYVRVEPSDKVGIERALFDLADMVGEFEKPRYVRVDPTICAHSRNRVVGCDLCLNACPTGAITPAGDHVHVDPFVCSGHGVCASLCPTGAIAFDLPAANGMFERLRVLAGTYRRAGGRDMVLLVHDPRHGDEMLSAMARAGRGLPAHVVPFAVNEVTVIGLDFLLTAFAFGVARIAILARAARGEDLGPLRAHATLVDVILKGLGYAGDRVAIEDEADPEALALRLRGNPPDSLEPAAKHRVTGEKRTTLMLALDHLHAHAPAPADVVELPVGAPFGRIDLDRDRCTLCLSCVGACPTGALHDHPEAPQLSFTEVNCVQCGLCRNTCPENAISLVPQINFAETARRRVVLKEEEDPFRCIRCGKPFATRSTIDRLVARLGGHAMFAAPGRIEMLRMCEDCRVAAQFDEPQPYAAGPRPLPRTTDDDLREREEANRLKDGEGR